MRKVGIVLFLALSQGRAYHATAATATAPHRTQILQYGTIEAINQSINQSGGVFVYVCRHRSRMLLSCLLADAAELSQKRMNEGKDTFDTPAYQACRRHKSCARAV
jgi:hypothetical protein